MYSFNLENIVPSGGLACLIAKAIINKSNKWHRRLGHVNFKNLNKLVKGNLVRGLPSKIFQNDHTCVASSKRKQNTRLCKAKFSGAYKMTTLVLLVRKESNTRPPVRPRIKREYSNAKTPQQNGVAERKNMTLIAAARTMLADSFLPNTFWAEVVSTACYVLNRNYQPVRLENQANKHAGPKEANHSAARSARASTTSTVNTVSTPVSTASPSGGLSFTHLTNTNQDDLEIPDLEESYDNPNDGIFTNTSYDDEGAVADFTNLETIVNVSPIPALRIHSIHPSTQISSSNKEQSEQKFWSLCFCKLYSKAEKK
ncbi:ribonuclease H-like domain-containing protein [Tanacetum coccineum]